MIKIKFTLMNIRTSIKMYMLTKQLRYAKRAFNDFDKIQFITLIEELKWNN